MDGEQEEKINKIRGYFEGRGDVVMAFLFGSQAKGKGHMHAHSDWDIAVYFKPRTDELEFENTDLEYPEEDRIWVDLTKILGTDDIDLVVLNRAPASIADEAIRGERIVIKNHGLWLRFMLLITKLAEEYRIFAKEYYEIAQRSRSLTPSDAYRLERNIIYLQEQQQLYEYYAQFTQEQYENDGHKRNDIEKWVENIMNAVIDVSQIIMASEHRAMPMAYRESVERSALALHVPEESARTLEKWVRLRNVLAHEYLDIKWKRISDFIHTSDLPIGAFIDAAKKFLEETLSGKSGK